MVDETKKESVFNAKVTIIEESNVGGGTREDRLRVLYLQSINELPHLLVGYRAEQIKLEITFNREDIPNIIEFINNCQPCFK